MTSRCRCRELFVTNVCIMAERLQNRYADTVVSLNELLSYIGICTKLDMRHFDAFYP